MSLRDIIREVAEDHGLTPEDITGRSRCRKIAHARQDAMWRARQVKWASGAPRYSAPMIGRALNRDHSTVLAGIEAHAVRSGLAEPKVRPPRRRRPPTTWRTLKTRLTWAYGPERATSIIDGKDPATNADIAKWNALGEPKAGAHKERAGL
ncbi:MAG: helix-turn-helix domain-containing protein [Ignavibacteriales bacterium]